ncbi:hypothetical protein HDU76_011096 [Blyttiomyces sp. JEL0837]|nr:hypothetical protein HDU76_011096 [Blyttiomyces sp. JEL0837]
MHGIFTLAALAATSLGLASAATPFAYKAYSATTSCTASEIRYPNTTSQVSDIIIEALSTFQFVKAMGSHHSATDIICTNGIAISMKGFNSIKIDEKNMKVTVGAGAHLVDLLNALQAKGLTLEHYPQFGGITIGGALATGAHGSSLKHYTLSDQITAVTVVDGMGFVQTITDESELAYFRVHLGLLGVVVDATFPVVPLYKVTLQTYPAPDSLLTSGAINAMIPNYDYFYLYWYPSLNSVAISNGTYVNPSTPGQGFWTTSSDILGPAVGAIEGLVGTLEQLQTARLSNVWCQIAAGNFANQFSPSQAPPYLNETYGYANPVTGYGKDIMNGVCTYPNCPWDLPVNPLRLVDISIAIPLSVLPDAAKAVQKILQQYPRCFAFSGIFLRFSKAGKGAVSMAYNRDTVHFEIYTERRLNATTDARLDIDAISAISQTLINQFGGRPHWGKNGMQVFQSSQLYRSQPRLGEFGIVASAQYDPFGIFRNEWSSRAFLGKHVPRGNGCALEDNCWCQTDSECAAPLKCVKSASYNVCA